MLICTTTAWVVLIALINFDRSTVPVDPLKSGTSTCSGLFSISLSLIPLLFSKKMSKEGEEGPWSTFVLHLQNSSLLGFRVEQKMESAQ